MLIQWWNGSCGIVTFAWREQDLDRHGRYDIDIREIGIGGYGKVQLLRDPFFGAGSDFWLIFPSQLPKRIYLRSLIKRKQLDIMLTNVFIDAILIISFNIFI